MMNNPGSISAGCFNAIFPPNQMMILRISIPKNSDIGEANSRRAAIRLLSSKIC